MRRGLIAVAVLVTISAAMPMHAAMGAKPVRSPIRGPLGLQWNDVGSEILPASQNACGVKLLIEPKSIGIDWVFSDDPHQEASIVVGKIKITNLVTGTSYLQTSDYHRAITIAADGTESVVISGSRWEGFYEGETGPEGVVGPGGAEYFVSGHWSFVYDPKKDVVSSYEFAGQAIDACEVLA